MDLFSHRTQDDLLKDLNPEQRTAVTHGSGPLLVVAGAGSGKTRVITRRVAYLVREGVAPHHIVAVTFTNKAAREMQQRVSGFVGAPDLWVSTFHSFCARLLRRHAGRLGYSAAFTIYDTEDRRGLIKEILQAKRLEDLNPAEVEQALSRAKNGLDATGSWRGGSVETVVDRYEEEMLRRNAMDFDDLLLRAVELLRDHADVREELCDRFRWILVDEYQDTNTVQYALLRSLAGERRNLCATGDPDQSIYRWRGATIRNILDFERDFPGAAVVTLNQNYRSTQAVLDVANAVIRHNHGRREKDLRTDNPRGEQVREVRCLDEFQEARTIVQQVVARRQAGMSLSSQAVFYRINAQSRVIERILHESAIPYQIVGAVEFYKRREVKDLLAYTRLALNPKDEIALFRVLNVPPKGIGKKSEERLRETAERLGVSPLEVFEDPAALASLGRSRKPLERFAALWERVAALPTDDAGVFMEELVRATGYREFLGAETAAAEVDRLENVDELLNSAAQFQLRRPDAGLVGFLEECSLVSDQDDYDETKERLVLMTVHSAKGLEFDGVIVSGLEEGLFPHARSMDPEEVEEERRLFYVAVTRARKELCLLHAATRTRFGMTEVSRPSRFLEEIPEELLHRRDRGDDFRRVPRDRVSEPASGGWDLPEDPWEGEEMIEREQEAPFRVGDRVLSEHFGAGRVAEVSRRGASTRITVDFDRSGRRQMMLSYARLKRI